MWTPTQIPASGQGLVTRGLGLAPKDVIVHITRLGGGFGRRGSNEFSLEAAAIAKRLEGTPVKLMWKREHDFAHDNYRSNGWHYFTAGLDGSGKVVGIARRVREDAGRARRHDGRRLSVHRDPGLGRDSRASCRREFRPGIGARPATTGTSGRRSRSSTSLRTRPAAIRSRSRWICSRCSDASRQRGRGFDPAKMSTVLEARDGEGGVGRRRVRAVKVRASRSRIPTTPTSRSSPMSR